MKHFLIKIIIFLILPLPLLLTLEVAGRQNSFAQKAAFIQAHSQHVEVLTLGSSHTWRAVNPQYLEFVTAPLAHGGSAFNIDFLLFRKFQPSFRQLRLVILEISVHSLEEWRSSDWNNNHLYLVHYGINNYSTKPAFKDYTLMSAAPAQHLKRILTKFGGYGAGTLNEWGFVTEPTEYRFRTLNFDAERIAETSAADWLNGRHEKEDQDAHCRNTALLGEIVATCRRESIKLILLSPPKYHLYNSHMADTKRERRQATLDKFVDGRNVLFWDDEAWQEDRPELYLNEDHLNPRGAASYTNEINRRLTRLLRKDNQSTELSPLAQLER